MKLPINKLLLNSGQIQDVPKNPRGVKDKQYEYLLKSLREDPDFLNHKPLHVYPHGDKFVVLGGNQRLRACRELGYKEVPVTIYDVETPVETLRRRVVIDNSNYGEWDMDALANEWSDEPLEEWGVDLKLGEDDDTDQTPTSNELECPECGHVNIKSAFKRVEDM